MDSSELRGGEAKSVKAKGVADEMQMKSQVNESSDSVQDP
jgi:hypothetical protein